MTQQVRREDTEFARRHARTKLLVLGMAICAGVFFGMMIWAWLVGQHRAALSCGFATVSMGVAAFVHWPLSWTLPERPAPGVDREQRLVGGRDLITRMFLGWLCQGEFDDCDADIWVRYVEGLDPEWLLDQFRNPGYPLANRCEVLGYMCKHQEQALELLELEGTVEERFAKARELAWAADAERRERWARYE